MTSARLAASVLFLLAWIMAVPARAHSNTASFSELAVGDREVVWTLRTRDDDMIFAMGDLDADGNGKLTQAELDEGRPRIRAYLLAKIGVSLDGRACAGALEEILLVPPDPDRHEGHRLNLQARLRFPLAYPPGSIALSCRLYEENDPWHRHVAMVSVRGGTPSAHFSEGGGFQELDASGGASRRRRVEGALRHGMVHILTGWDHLLFLAALAVSSGRVGPLLVLVTGFTAGHTATLVLAGLDLVTAPRAPVEAAVAFSVAFVGWQNTRPQAPRHRWIVAVLFGLVHGLAFAGDLRGRLPPDMLVLSLLLFNVGVEVGQVALLAAIWPILRWAGRHPAWARRGSRGVSWIIASVGVGLCVARLAACRMRQ